MVVLSQIKKLHIRVWIKRVLEGFRDVLFYFVCPTLHVTVTGYTCIWVGLMTGHLKQLQGRCSANNSHTTDSVNNYYQNNVSPMWNLQDR